MAESRPGLRLWDRLVLLVAWGATCGIVFLLGLSVGRGTNPQSPTTEERVVRLPVNTPAPPVAPAAVPGDDVTFYERLVAADRKNERTGEPRAAVAREGVIAPAPVQAKPKAAAPPAVQPGSAQAAAAAKAVGAAVSSPSAKVAAIAKPAPSPAAAPARPAAATPPATKTAPATLANVAPAPSENSKKPAAGPQPPLKAGRLPPDAPPATKPAVATTKKWTLTMNPTPDRYEAEALVHQLKGKGYSAALVQTAKGNTKQYRVKIGQYGSSAEAATAAKRLQRDGLQGAVPASTD